MREVTATVTTTFEDYAAADKARDELRAIIDAWETKNNYEFNDFMREKYGFSPAHDSYIAKVVDKYKAVEQHEFI